MEITWADSGTGVKTVAFNLPERRHGDDQQTKKPWRSCCIPWGFHSMPSPVFTVLPHQPSCAGWGPLPKKPTRSLSRVKLLSLSLTRCGTICIRKKQTLDLESLLSRYRSAHWLGMWQSRPGHPFQTDGAASSLVGLFLLHWWMGDICQTWLPRPIWCKANKEP
jgi:hypothetical protein